VLLAEALAETLQPPAAVPLTAASVFALTLSPLLVDIVASSASNG
jgi:hypothetical protein